MSPTSLVLRPLAAAILVTALFAPALCRADEYTDRANALYNPISMSKRSDLVVLPAVAKMQPPPAVVGTLEKAMMLPASSSSFKAAADWASADTQQAVLAAIGKVTQIDKAEKPEDAYAFGQPYGADSVAGTADGVTLIQAGLYTDLGDPPMLASAKFLVLPALDNVACLVNVEATRLAAAGDFDKSLKVLIDWLFFARQMADRAFFQESRWGWRAMIAAADRLRDVVYTDFRYGEHKITNEQLQSVLQRIRADGYLNTERVLFPRANQIAADQMVAKVFNARDGINDAVFGSTMARLATSDRPLRLFAEAARWNGVAAGHANWFDTTDMIKRVFGDLERRWRLEPFDPTMSFRTDYEKMPRDKYAAIAAVVPDMTVLFNDRQVCRAQLVGTRMALGIMAFQNRNKNWPPDISSIRPTWVRVIEADPFNSDPERAHGKVPPLEYFVPIRDQKVGAREEPKPAEINVVTRGGQFNFKTRVGQDQFVLYSVGPDGAKDMARNVEAEPPKGAIGDLLLWPPVTSLLRQRLGELGDVK
jgi:hypothetical protein